MSHEAQLLRMLEPAVRPGNLPAPTRPATPPVEQRDFETLLQEATAQVSGTNDEGAPDAGRTPKDSPDPLAPLGTLGRIENQSLRQLLSAHGVDSETRKSA